MCEDNNCGICGCEIRGGTEQYSCVLEEEYFDNGAYTVSGSETITTTCIDCQKKFKVNETIDTNLKILLKKLPNRVKKENNITPIHNHYDCIKCKSPIKDGDTLISINHYREIWNGGCIEPVNVWMMNPLCQSCSNDIDFRTIVFKVINEIITKVKRADFHNKKVTLL